MPIKGRSLKPAMLFGSHTIFNVLIAKQQVVTREDIEAQQYERSMRVRGTQHYGRRKVLTATFGRFKLALTFC